MSNTPNTNTNTPSTMSLVRGFSFVPVLEDDGVTPVRVSVDVSDTAAVNVDALTVDRVSVDVLVPSSDYLLDAAAFVKAVKAAALAMSVNDARAVLAKYDNDITDARQSDKTDVNRLAVLIYKRSLLADAIDGIKAALPSDKIACCFAYAAINPRFVKIDGAADVLATIRGQYAADKIDAKAVKTAVETFAARSICVTDDTKSKVYKNVKARLNNAAAVDVVNAVCAVRLKYGKKGISENRLKDTAAVTQILLFVLRDTFGLAVAKTRKTDANTYLIF